MNISNPIPNTTGVYQLRNLVNGKVYIGSTANLTTGFRGRKSSHFGLLRHNKHHSDVLQEAYDIYGVDNFIFEIVEECNPESAVIREQFYIDENKPEYNKNKIAVGKSPVKYTKQERDNLLKLRRDNQNKYSKEYIKLKEDNGWRYFSVMVPEDCHGALKKEYLRWKSENLELWDKLKDK